MSNNLANESSPYLLQHKDNPVNWYSWNDESLQKAKSENKPIFLSVGYSSCHWCHVMAHESFENKNIAALMNKYFFLHNIFFYSTQKIFFNIIIRKFFASALRSVQ